MGKKLWVAAAVCVMVLVGSNSVEAAAGSVYIAKAYHALTIRLDSNGYLVGIVSARRIHASQVVSANFSSDRRGWDVASVANGGKVRVGYTLTFRINNTANNDQGTWSIKLKDGTYRWVNLDRFTYSGLARRRIGNQIQYGTYQTSRIDFYYPGWARVSFGSNVIPVCGFLQDNQCVAMNTSDVAWVQWNSDDIGWNDASNAFGYLGIDGVGNYYVDIGGMLDADTGTFSVKLLNGSWAWLNIDGWLYGSGVTLDHAAGQLTYSTRVASSQEE